MNKEQKRKALSDVRGAIKGWAFAPDDWLPGMIELAEQAIAALPDELKEEGNELLSGIRKSAEKR